MRRATILGIAASAAVLSGCATTDDLPTMSEMLRDATDQSGRACIDKSEIDGYGVLENNVISIDGEDDYYLATVSPNCDKLPRSLGGGLDDDDVDVDVDEGVGDNVDVDIDVNNNSSDNVSDALGGGFGEICGGSGDALYADDDDCEIHQVFEFDDREDAFETFNEVMEVRERFGED